jgi:hypothetical protein
MHTVQVGASENKQKGCARSSRSPLSHGATFDFRGKTDTQFRTEYDDFANAVINDPRENER